MYMLNINRSSWQLDPNICYLDKLVYYLFRNINQGVLVAHTYIVWNKIAPLEVSYQSLVGSVVIGAELGREDHGSIPRNCDREGAGTT
jgi:hypothetical protein